MRRGATDHKFRDRKGSQPVRGQPLIGDVTLRGRSKVSSPARAMRHAFRASGSRGMAGLLAEASPKPIEQHFVARDSCLQPSEPVRDVCVVFHELRSGQMRGVGRSSMQRIVGRPRTKQVPRCGAAGSPRRVRGCGRGGDTDRRADPRTLAEDQNRSARRQRLRTGVPYDLVRAEPGGLPLWPRPQPAARRSHRHRDRPVAVC